jgi:hypothetical protein
VATLLSRAAAAQAPASTAAPDGIGPQLEGVYRTYLAAAHRGDASAVSHMLVAEQAPQAAGLSPEFLRGMSADDLDPRQSERTRIDVAPSAHVARLVYRQRAGDARTWQAVILRREHDQWKIAKIVRRATSGAGATDDEAALLSETDPYLQEP